MAAITRFHLDAVFIGILAGLTAILLSLYLRGEGAITQVVRALNRLVHGRLFPAYWLFSTSPPRI
jgi:hypothetical protein